MELLQLGTLNLSDQPVRSFSGVDHFHLAGKKFHLCMQHADPAHQIVLTGRAVLSRGDIRFPSHLSFLLLESFGSLSPGIRHSLIRNLVMLRNKGVTSSFEYRKSTFPSLEMLNVTCLVFSKRHSRFSLGQHPPYCVRLSEERFSQTSRRPTCAQKITNLIVPCRPCSLAWSGVEWVGRSCAEGQSSGGDEAMCCGIDQRAMEERRSVRFFSTLPSSGD